MVSKRAGRVLLQEHAQARHGIGGAELRIGTEVSTAVRATDGVAGRVPEEIGATPGRLAGANKAGRGADDRRTHDSGRPEEDSTHAGRIAARVADERAVLDGRGIDGADRATEARTVRANVIGSIVDEHTLRDR